MTGVSRDTETDPTITWCHSRGKPGFITWPQATPTLSYVGRSPGQQLSSIQQTMYNLCVWGLAAEVAGKVTYTGQQSPDIPHSSQVRFDWNVFLCPTKYNNVRQYQTMFRKNCYFVTIGRDYRSHNMVCFWWKILPNVYLRQKRNPSLWLIWKWLIKSVIACVTNSQQLQVFVTIYCAKKEVWDVITDTMIHSHFQYPALQQVLNHLHCISSSALTRSP